MLECGLQSVQSNLSCSPWYFPPYAPDLELCDGEMASKFEQALDRTLVDEVQCECQSDCEGVTFEIEQSNVVFDKETICDEKDDTYRETFYPMDEITERRQVMRKFTFTHNSDRILTLEILVIQFCTRGYIRLHCAALRSAPFRHWCRIGLLVQDSPGLSHQPYGIHSVSLTLYIT